MADVEFLIAVVIGTICVAGCLWAFGVIADPEQEEMWLVTSQELERVRATRTAPLTVPNMKRTTT